MTKREINDLIIDTVCTVCEVSKEDIITGIKRAEVVEARCIAAHYLIRYGVLPSDVVRFSGNVVKHRHCVTKSANLYDDRIRQSFSFRSDAEYVGKILDMKFKETVSEVKP